MKRDEVTNLLKLIFTTDLESYLISKDEGDLILNIENKIVDVFGQCMEDAMSKIYELSCNANVHEYEVFLPSDINDPHMEKRIQEMAPEVIKRCKHCYRVVFLIGGKWEEIK